MRQICGRGGDEHGRRRGIQRLLPALGAELNRNPWAPVVLRGRRIDWLDQFGAIGIEPIRARISQADLHPNNGINSCWRHRCGPRSPLGAETTAANGNK